MITWGFTAHHKVMLNSVRYEDIIQFNSHWNEAWIKGRLQVYRITEQRIIASATYKFQSHWIYTSM